MTDLPTPEVLAGMVSHVTQTMLGMTFSLTEVIEMALPWDHLPPWRTVVLPIRGARAIQVGIASDEPSGVLLGSAMFSCRECEVDASMIDDSLRELANIVAGQVKRAVGLDQALGLPRVVRGPDDPDTVGRLWRSARLLNGGRTVTVWVAITEL